jgi:hypothetical protein
LGKKLHLDFAFRKVQNLTIFRALLPNSKKLPKQEQILNLPNLLVSSTAMSTIDDLKQKFAILPVEDLGECITIPGEQLDLDWILTFLEEGYRFEGSRLDGHPVVLVQVTPMVIDIPDKMHKAIKRVANSD